MSIATAGSRGSTDPAHDAPYIDIDEWRDEPIRHRYVHGGFEGTDTRFSIYLPPPERYEGRFFHPLMPISGMETGATNPLALMMGESIQFAFASGGYLVESNQGRFVMFPGEDSTLAGFRASAATARFSRTIAAGMYGEHRPFGYVFGGSGGAFKTISCVESTNDVWDGSVPFVHGSPVSMPNVFTVQAHAFRILREKFPQIVDAIEPGGSGDMYAGLNVEEREALAEVTRLGFPPRSWFDVNRISVGYTGVFSALLDKVVAWDPTYFEDFWTKPGYLGANPPDSLIQARIEHKTTISKIVTTTEAVEMGLPISMSARYGDTHTELPAAVRVENPPESGLQGAALTFTSGAAAGHVMYIAGVIGDLVLTGFGEEHFESLRGVQVGDEVQIDNEHYLAAQTYHRHQMPGREFYPWDQFLVAGTPIHPQRSAQLGERFARQGSGSSMSGRFAGKMIVVEALMDEAAFPWQADWYRTLVKQTLGRRLDDSYRLWFIDHAMHTTPMDLPGDPLPARTTRVVSYVGVLQQALRDVSAWVEHGIIPPESTVYDVDDAQIRVPASAAARKGIQPVVSVRANGHDRADVAVGEPVEFSALIEVPPATGTIVAVEWDFEGRGDYPVVEEIDDATAAQHRMPLTRTYAFSEPGTYFPAVRATSHRHGDIHSPFGRVHNLGRVRVVVG
ncbi:MAG TPA: hypothetical protein VMH41_08500 [Mycobacteriales bacterium]|nr:hypothetical protein [Mycobacteriales bacterium]